MKYLKDIIYIFIIIALTILLICTHIDDNFNFLDTSDWINLTIGLITSISTIIIGYATIQISSFPFTKKLEISHYLDCQKNCIDFTAYIYITNVGFCPIAIKCIELYDNKYLVEERYLYKKNIITNNNSTTIKLKFQVTDDFKHTKKKKIVITDITGKKFTYKFSNYAVG